MKRYVQSVRNFREMDDGDETLSKINRFIQQLSRQYREETDGIITLIWVCYKVKTYGESKLYRVTEMPKKQVSYILDNLKNWSFIKQNGGSVKLDLSYDEPVINIRFNS